MQRQAIFLTGLIQALYLLGPTAMAFAQQAASEQPGWSNSSELSVVVTDGNSGAQTLGFKNTARRVWKRARLKLRLEGVRSETREGRFAVVETDSPGNIRVVEPSGRPAVEKYLIESRYDRQINDRFFWNSGLSWERNQDAGLLNRYVAYIGVGHVWWDRQDLRFETAYGASLTDRQEGTRDPAKQEQFPGFRFSWSYLNRWGRNTTFTNDWAGNTNLSDLSDFSSDMTSSVAVSMNSRIALKVSLQWLYNHSPALEELDLFAIDEAGNLDRVGSFSVRKKQLDTVFTTSLVINL